MQFVLLDLIKNPNQEKVVTFFDDLEERIGTDAFIELIPVILTDRDPNFTDIDGICFSKITGEERCKLFFCNSYVSSQKPNVENMNKQLNIPKSFKEAGIDEAEFLAKVDLLADRAFEDQCTTANPRVPLVSEIKQMLLDSFYGK